MLVDGFYDDVAEPSEEDKVHMEVIVGAGGGAGGGHDVAEPSKGGKVHMEVIVGDGGGAGGWG